MRARRMIYARREDSNIDEWATTTVGQIARAVAPLNPSDSIAHAVEVMRTSGLHAYPVVANGHIVLAALSDVTRYIGCSDDVENARLSPVMAAVTVHGNAFQGTPILSSAMPIEEATRYFEEYGNPDALAVAGPDGRFVGVLAATDLLAARIRTLGPPRIGGMATPIGVYLTDGVNAGGAGTTGLILTGVCLGVLSVLAAVITFRVDVYLAAHPAFDPYRILETWAVGRHMAHAAQVVDEFRSYLTLLLLLVFMRFVPLSGYHAAEHQVVHCTERGQPLTVEVVRKMPRVHPRCGTNLVAALTVFGLVMALGSIYFQGVVEAVLPSVLLTLALWQPVGSFFQQYFTTRPASEKQLRSGIAAAEALMRNYRTGVSRKGSPGLRVWRMGLVQVMMGWAIVWLATFLAGLLIPDLRACISLF